MASKRKSYVWNYFQVIDKEEGGKAAKCKLCASVLSYSGSSTSSLGKHLSSKHPSETQPAEAGPSGLRQTSVAKYLRRTDDRPCSAQRRQQLLDLLSEVIYQDMRPLSMIRSQSFRKFLNFVEPNFSVPSFATLRSNIVKLYDSQRQKVSDQLKELSVISLSTDHWTSAMNDAYLGVTVHGINEDWKMLTMNLGTKVTSERHTAENIVGDLDNIIQEWEIPEVFAIVHDNAANITNAVARMEANSVPCFAHTIQLAIKAGLSTRTVSNLLANARSLAGFFRKSNPAWLKLKEKQRERDPNATVLKPIQDVPTRWNSTFLMLQRLVSLKDAIAQVANDPTLGLDTRRYQVKNLRDDEWYLAHELSKILEPLAQATEIWCGEAYVNISITYPILCGLLEKLVPSEADLPALHAFKREVRDQINERFRVQRPDLGTTIPILACALDPRFKDLAFIPTNNVKEAAFTEIERLTAKYGPEMEAEMQPTQTKKTVLQSLLGQAFSQDPNQGPGDTIKAELARYRELRQQDSAVDPLDWWKSQRMWFPRVAHLARIILAVPATSAPSERLFSSAGEVLSKKRLRMEPQFADKLLFLRENNKSKTVRNEQSDSSDNEDF